MKTPNDLLQILSRHIGSAKGASVDELARQLDIPERAVRKLVSDLREEGHAVCGHPKTGYYIAETAEELEATCQFLRSRAMHSLNLEARLRKVPLADLIGQFHLKT